MVMDKRTLGKKTAGHVGGGAETGRGSEIKVSETTRSRRSDLANRPCLRDAILWSIPAILLATLLHSFIIYHTPLAYWSKDSGRSSSLPTSFSPSPASVSMPSDATSTRSFLCPPRASGRDAVVGEDSAASLALGSVIAFGYIVRKTFAAWKLLIIPATLIYALHPHFLYYTGQVLAESLSLNLLVLSIAGWAAWIGRPDSPTRFPPFLLFFIPFALFILTKPSHRFLWPGLIVAFFLSGSWRWLRRPHFAALAGLALLTLTVGKEEQGLRLFYASVFPLTQLQTPSHADYKEAIADMVEEARAALPRYAFTDKKYKSFLEYPDRYPLAGDLWADLKKKDNRSLKDHLLSGPRVGRHHARAAFDVLHRPAARSRLAPQRCRDGANARELSGRATRS